MFTSLFISIFNWIFGTNKYKPSDSERLMAESDKLNEQLAAEHEKRKKRKYTDVGKW